MSEFIFYWCLAGVALDMLLMVFMAHIDRSFWEKQKISMGEVRSEIPECGLLYQIKETPWWAHVGMVILPPSTILAFSLVAMENR